MHLYKEKAVNLKEEIRQIHSPSDTDEEPPAKIMTDTKKSKKSHIETQEMNSLVKQAQDDHRYV